MNLESELRAAADKVRQQHIDRMVSLGVSAEAMATLCYFDSHLAVAEVEEVSGLFVPCEGKPLHFLTPIRSAGHLIDVAAWRPLKPNRWLLRSGAGWCLNEDAALGDWDQTLTLHSTILDWLRSAGDGICILDWSHPRVRELGNLRAVKVRDPAIGRVLISTLSRPLRLPEIIETKEAKRAA